MSCILFFSLKDVHKHVAENLEQWEEIFQSDTPHLAPFPDPYSTLEGINRLAVIKCLRPDKIILAVQVNKCYSGSFISMMI